jgi:hypothetical protein
LIFSAARPLWNWRNEKQQTEPNDSWDFFHGEMAYLISLANDINPGENRRRNGKLPQISILQTKLEKWANS